jgi:hypothetical protein
MNQSCERCDATVPNDQAETAVVMDGYSRGWVLCPTCQSALKNALKSFLKNASTDQQQPIDWTDVLDKLKPQTPQPWVPQPPWNNTYPYSGGNTWIGGGAPTTTDGRNIKFVSGTTIGVGSSKALQNVTPTFMVSDLREKSA